MKLTVLILQEQVPPYRVPFFRFLRDELGSHGFDLHVLSSTALPEVNELGFRHQYVSASRGGLLALESIYHERPKALILPHDARFAPIAIAARLLQRRGQKQLFWGMGLARRYGVSATHGGSQMAATWREGKASVRARHVAGEGVRLLMLSTCDHYLSYTELSTASLYSKGYDTTRITTLNNAVEALATPEQATQARRVPFKIIFVASLVEDKEPLAAVGIVDQLRKLAPNTTLHIVGDGPLRSRCEQAANRREWVHCHGALRGQSLRELALSSDIAIIPGRVGLAVLEMASAGLPIATFESSLHGAEIAYLKDSVNGLLLATEIESAARKLEALLTDRAALEHMRNEALDIASKYTVKKMAVNFAEGVLTSLQ